MTTPHRRWKLFFALCLSITFSSCVYKVGHMAIDDVPRVAGTSFGSSVKAHLIDGSTILFPTGATVTTDSIRGSGVRYDLLGQIVGNMRGAPIDSVAALENYRRVSNPGASVLVSLATTAAGVVGGALLAAAIFGSCPTYYTIEDNGPRLQAEGFSYSIAPILEGRDVDLLNTPTTSGQLVLEIRNEALETHYINHMELLVVDHARYTTVYPDHRGQPVLIERPMAVRRATTRTGRDLSAQLARVDDRVVSASNDELASVSLTDMHDEIDLDLGPAEADSVALVINARNSLLSTVLLYDLMLAKAGPRAVDWLGEELEQIGPASELGKWYARSMGLHVATVDNGNAVEIARVPDVGPIAWKEFVVVLPARKGEPLHVRLTYPTDGWRIDAVRYGVPGRKISIQATPVSSVSIAGSSGDSVITALADPDDKYVTTVPGQHFSATFTLPPRPPETERTLLIASQGYYSEWIRANWLRAKQPKYFEPSDASLLEAINLWSGKRAEFETRFFSSRIQVR